MALRWRDLSSSFSLPLSPPDILSGDPFPIQIGHLAEKPPPAAHECSPWETSRTSIIVEENPSGAVPSLSSVFS